MRFSEQSSLKRALERCKTDLRKLSNQLISANSNRSKFSHQLAPREADLAEAGQQLGEGRLTEV